MENELTEGRTLSLNLPAALDAWLTERADELGVEESELLLQVIGSYQVAAETEDEAAEELADTIAGEDIEMTIRETVDDAVAAAAPDEDAIARRVEDRLVSRLDGIEEEFEEKLEDVRRRVVQVKQEADAKAGADHDHEEFRRLDRLASTVEELQERVDESEAESEGADERAARTEQVDDIRSKLTQLARVVVQLRDEMEGETTDDETLVEIQRTAAREGYERAVCAACDETVHVGLLPEAECPHCRSPFGSFAEGSGGLFASKPRLVGPSENQRAGPDDGESATTSSSTSEERTGGEGGDGSPMSADGGTHE
jgi:hypothetical protein